MPSFSVSCDLRAPGRNYQPLYDALQKAGAVRALRSLWLLDDPGTAVQIREALMLLVDENDGILVIEMVRNSHWAACKMLPGAAEWLRARTP